MKKGMAVVWSSTVCAKKVILKKVNIQKLNEKKNSPTPLVVHTNQFKVCISFICLLQTYSNHIMSGVNSSYCNVLPQGSAGIDFFPSAPVTKNAKTVCEIKYF